MHTSLHNGSGVTLCWVDPDVDKKHYKDKLDVTYNMGVHLLEAINTSRKDTG